MNLALWFEIIELVHRDVGLALAEKWELPRFVQAFKASPDLRTRRGQGAPGVGLKRRICGELGGSESRVGRR